MKSLAPLYVTIVLTAGAALAATRVSGALRAPPPTPDDPCAAIADPPSCSVALGQRVSVAMPPKEK